MKKVLHLINNDKKFIDVIIREFENNSEIENTFILEINNNTKPETLKKIICKTSKELCDVGFIDILKNYDILFVHSLTASRAKLISKISFNIIIIWGAWGGDFYHHHPLLKKTLLEEKTALLEKKLLPYFKEVFGRPILQAIYPQRFLYYWQQKAIKRINYIAPVIYDDYELIKEYYLAPHLKYLSFSYGNLEEDLLNGIPKKFELGDNILLGNSSTFSNNHIEIIDLLSEINLENRKVITPLSYGVIKLKDYLVKYGNEKLNNNFMPLVDFISPEKYHQLLTTCGIVIMNQKRQQGLGNIVTMLY